MKSPLLIWTVYQLLSRQAGERGKTLDQMLKEFCGDVKSLRDGGIRLLD